MKEVVEPTTSAVNPIVVNAALESVEPSGEAEGILVNGDDDIAERLKRLEDKFARIVDALTDDAADRKDDDDDDDDDDDGDDGEGPGGSGFRCD